MTDVKDRAYYEAQAKAATEEAFVSDLPVAEVGRAIVNALLAVACELEALRRANEPMQVTGDELKVTFGLSDKDVKRIASEVLNLPIDPPMQATFGETISDVGPGPGTERTED